VPLRPLLLRLLLLLLLLLLLRVLVFDGPLVQHEPRMQNTAAAVRYTCCRCLPPSCRCRLKGGWRETSTPLPLAASPTGPTAPSAAAMTAAATRAAAEAAALRANPGTCPRRRRLHPDCACFAAAHRNSSRCRDHRIFSCRRHRQTLCARRALQRGRSRLLRLLLNAQPHALLIRRLRRWRQVAEAAAAVRPYLSV
jgi:hypothetical protein